MILLKSTPNAYDISLWKQQGMLPLGCTQVDLNKVSDKEAVDVIQAQIKEKQERQNVVRLR